MVSDDRVMGDEAVVIVGSKDGAVVVGFKDPVVIDDKVLADIVGVVVW